jgi:hypothetical protein
MDRGNRGTKRSLVLDGHAKPLGCVVDGANRHALKRVEATLEALTVERPEATDAEPQPTWMDQGDDNEVVRATLVVWGDRAPVRRHGEARQAKREISGYQARCWLDETLSTAAHPVGEED